MTGDDLRRKSQEANLVRNTVLDDFTNGRITFDDVLAHASTHRAIARMRMSRVLKAHGWRKRQFAVVINALNSPVNNRLEWWVSPKGKDSLERLVRYMTSGELRASVPERFPWTDAPVDR